MGIRLWVREQADHDDISTDLGIKLPLKNPEDNNTTKSVDLSLDRPVQNVIQEDKIPTCEMGDDEVFYMSTGEKRRSNGDQMTWLAFIDSDIYWRWNRRGYYVLTVLYIHMWLNCLLFLIYILGNCMYFVSFMWVSHLYFVIKMRVIIYKGISGHIDFGLFWMTI